MNPLARVLEDSDRLLNGSGKMDYFERRELGRDVVQDAGIGVENGWFLYPCISRSCELLGVHVKSERRNGKGKREQEWRNYAPDLALKANGKQAKVIPFGLDTLGDPEPGSPVILCCGEEDALSLRQAGYTTLSQPGAGLLEPVYAREFAGHEVVVFYDAGEERAASKDAQKLLEAGAMEVRVVPWPPEAPNGADVNGRLVEDPETFGDWAARMMATAQPLPASDNAPPQREGVPDQYDGASGALNGKVVHPVGTLLSEVAPEEVEWLWEGRIPKGKVAVLDGDPGLGKSTVTIDIGAHTSTGRSWPDGGACKAGGVVICSAEDGLADTIRPRLDAAGGDPERVLALTTVMDGDSERLLSIPEDLDVVRQAIEQVGAKLLIVDPQMAFLSGRHDAHRDQDVRRALAPLARLAEEMRVAVLVVRHLNKSSGGNPLYRGGGSIGIVGAARSAYLVARHPEDENLRVLAPLKSNLAAPAPSLAFGVSEAPNGAARVEWKGETRHTADALLAAPTDPEKRSALEEAKDYIRETLAGGPRGAQVVLEEAHEAGISGVTLKRAKKDLGVVSKKAADGPWTWRWPEGQGGQQEPEPKR